MRELHPINWLRIAGIGVWVFVAATLLFVPLVVEDPIPASRILGWWSAAILFLVSFLHPAVRLAGHGATWKRIISLVAMTVAVFAVSWFSRTGLGVILAVVIAGILPWLMPHVVGLLWVVGISVVFAVWIWLLPRFGLSWAILQLTMTLCLMLFAYFASLLACNQLRARNELRRVNSELRATQALLAENTRIAERVRIARELHDLIGHHLTALSLNLEVASHITADKAKHHVDQAASIARLLLSDVREVVSDMREGEEVDLRQAIRELASGVPEPEIHLAIPDTLALTDPRRAQILLRCAQEVITNAVRHADASNLWIRLVEGDDGLRLEARDDGRGAAEPDPGTGLRGMRERLTELGGRLEVVTRPGAGFRVNAWMPRESAC